MIVEPFAAAGGFTAGLRWAGCEDRAIGIEIDLTACRTAVAAGHERICADVSTYPPERFGDADGAIFGPPCPPFSRAGKGLGIKDQPALWRHAHQVSVANKWVDYPRTGWHDPRSPLVLEVLRWVLAIHPCWFAAEQVPAVLPFWRELARILSDHGYHTAAYLVHAEEYGVPQTRTRAILVGSLNGLPNRPSPTHQRYVPGVPPQGGEHDLFGTTPVLPWVSMAEALGWGLEDRPAWTVTAGGTATGGAEVFGNAKCRDRLRNTVYRASNQEHSARRAPTEPAPTVLFSQRSNKVEWIPAELADDPAASGVRVTVEEAGVLQGFSADYPWRGTQSQRYRQVGDAVPPSLAAAILRPLIEGGAA